MKREDPWSDDDAGPRRLSTGCAVAAIVGAVAAVVAVVYILFIIKSALE